MGLRMRISLYAAGALWLAAGPVAAQSSARPAVPLTLAQARAMARQSSPDVTAARAAVAAAVGREEQAGGFSNPALVYGREQTSGENETTSQDVVSLNQPLDIFGQRSARRQAAARQRNAAEARLAGALARVDYDVTRSYAAASATRRRAELAQAVADAFIGAERVARTRLAEGDISGYEHRRLRLEAARYASLRLEAAVARDSALGILASLIGWTDSLAAGDRLTLSDTLPPAALAYPIDSLVARALAGRAELRAAELEIGVGEAEARLAGAERIPIPVISGGYKSERLTTGARLGGFIAGLSLALPLWDRRGGAVAAARAETARRTAEAESLRQRSIREVRTAYQSHQALASELALLRSHLGDEAATARRAAETAYAEGEISLLEWLDSVRAYQEAESLYVTLWSEYVTRRAALERLTGLTLF